MVWVEDIDFDAPEYNEINKYFAYEAIHRSAFSELPLKTRVSCMWSDSWGETYEQYDLRVKDCQHEDIVPKKYHPFDDECTNCLKWFHKDR